MKTILIVDDLQENLYLLEVLLKSQDFDVHMAPNGIEALEAAKQKTPDLIISDILMPSMDGFSLCQEWKKDEKLRVIPFIFYTATYTDDKDEEYALSLGADRFIKKPIQPDVFLNQILDVIAEYGQTKKPAREPLIKDEEESYKIYSERLIQKLEKKMLDLEDEIKTRKKIEEELRQSRQEWEEIFQAIGNPTMIIDPDYTVIKANRATIKTMKSTEEKIIGKKCHEIFHHADEPRVNCPMAHLKQNQTMQIGETEIEAWGGTYLVSCTPVFDRHGAFKKAIHIAMDITDRKRLEESIKESERFAKESLEELENIYTHAPVGLALLNKNLEFVRINQALADINGRLVSDHIGRELKEIIPELAQEIEPVYRKILETGEPALNFDIHGTTDAEPGIEKDWLVSYYPLKGPDGKTKGISTIVLDITERKKLESKLQHAHKLEALGTLAGGIAHDFNNILAAVIGYSELLLDEIPKEPPQLQENLSEVLVAGNRARDLVKQILIFSRQAEQEIKPLHINSVVHGAIKMLRATIPSTIKIQESICEKILTLEADETQIHQIIFNLATNAAHAMSEHGGTLQIGVEPIQFDQNIRTQYPDLEPGHFAQITVSDTGCGISNNQLDQIFDPYFTTKEKGKGTGLGLAVVHGIVKTYRGHITVYSEIGNGTTFNIYLPLAERGGEITTLRTRGQIPEGTEHILLVDDEPTIVSMQSQMLENLGYTVTNRSNGLEALEAFRAAPAKFNLIITDMTMPNLTGEKLAAELKKIKPDIPVVLCTGFSEQIDSAEASQLNIDGFLMKPVDRVKMAKTIRKLLDNK